MPENLVCKKQSVSGHGDQTRHAKWRHEVRPGGATPVIQTRERDSRAVARSRSGEAKYTSSRSGAAFSVRSSVRTRLYSSLACVFDLLPVVFDLQVTLEVTVDFRWRASFSPPQLWRVALSGGPCPLRCFSRATSLSTAGMAPDAAVTFDMSAASPRRSLGQAMLNASVTCFARRLVTFLDLASALSFCASALEVLLPPPFVLPPPSSYLRSKYHR